ncbi:MAG TPA: hypothetical protein VGG19_14895 [Tepidisphaeraceae bacterium]|jgi:hypothetical protein
MELKEKKSTTVIRATLVIAKRQQTLEEEREFNAAFNLLLIEIVRQNMGCKERDNERF